MGDNHLNILLHRSTQHDLWLLGAVSSIKPGRFFDPACILDQGDHPYLRHPSYVVYAKMHEIRTVHISRMVGKGVYVAKEPLSQHVFDRVVKGLFASDEVRPRRVAEIRRSGLAPSWVLTLKRNH